MISINLIKIRPYVLLLLCHKMYWLISIRIDFNAIYWFMIDGYFFQIFKNEENHHSFLLVVAIPVANSYNVIYDFRNTKVYLGLNLISYQLIFSRPFHLNMHWSGTTYKQIFLTLCLGYPNIEGNTTLGASSPANPALHIPDPLSITNASMSSLIVIFVFKLVINLQ